MSSKTRFYRGYLFKTFWCYKQDFLKANVLKKLHFPIFNHVIAKDYRFRKNVICKSFSSEVYSEGNAHRFSKIPLSGEILKENFTDVFYTNLEVIAFSFFTAQIENGVLPFISAKGNFPKNFPTKYVRANSESVHPINFVSLNVKIGDYLASGDKIGLLTRKRSFFKASAFRNYMCHTKPQIHRHRSYKPDPPNTRTGVFLVAKPPALSPKRFARKGRWLRHQEKPSLLALCTLSSSLHRRCIEQAKSSPKVHRERGFSWWRSHLAKLISSSPKGFARLYITGRSLCHQEKPSLLALCTFGAKSSPKVHRKRGFARRGSQDLAKSSDKAFKIPIILGSSGRVLAISKTQLIIQKTQPVLFYDSANLHVKKGEWVKEGTPILTLTHQTLITGDIVQGIPRIEQLFEAFTSPPPGLKERKEITQSRFKNVHDTLHSQVRDIFRKYWLKNVLPIAVRKSLEEIQYNIVEMIQKVYLSQGVLIADKHIEIIIRQMTSKGQILDSGNTGLLLEEVLPIKQIENANITTPGKKCLYGPAVVGLTTAALTCDSFISAASFQETTRVLSRDAVVGKSDFLAGLKEKVVIGDLISAGTGLDIYFIYRLFSEMQDL